MMEPIEQQHIREMNGIADMLKACFPGKGFALFVYPINETGTINYISNTERQSTIQAMEEWIKHRKEDQS